MKIDPRTERKAQSWGSCSRDAGEVREGNPYLEHLSLFPDVTQPLVDLGIADGTLQMRSSICKLLDPEPGKGRGAR